METTPTLRLVNTTKLCLLCGFAMNKKFFYFGVRLQELVVGTTGAPRRREVVRWAPAVYDSAESAATAAAKAMTTRLGVSFFVQGFERPLDITPDGISKGFKEA